MESEYLETKEPQGDWEERPLSFALEALALQGTKEAGQGCEYCYWQEVEFCF